MKVYLAGPMSGKRHFGIEDFEEATQVLRDHGHVVISPVEMKLDIQDREVLMRSETGDHADLPRPYDEYLHEDLEILRSEPGLEAIVTLPGWEKSNGTARELEVAFERGLPRYDYDPIYGFLMPYGTGHAEYPGGSLYDASGNFISFADNPLRQRTITGGVKDNRGKLPIDLVPYEALKGAADVLAYGAVKYKPNNWRLGLKWSETWASLQRHLWAWKEGEDLDPETGKSHIDHAMCQMLFLATYVHDPNMKQFDDRWINSDHDEAKA